MKKQHRGGGTCHIDAMEIEMNPNDNETVRYDLKSDTPKHLAQAFNESMTSP